MTAVPLPTTVTRALRDIVQTSDSENRIINQLIVGGNGLNKSPKNRKITLIIM